MATETHVAGLELSVSDQFLVQRCAWCGAVLLAYDLTMLGWPGDTPPEDRRPAMLPVGGLVRFSYDGTVARWGEVSLSRTLIEPLDGLDSLPDDACALCLPFDVVTAGS